MIPRPSSTRWPLVVLLTILTAVRPRPARAENGFRYLYQDYHETNGRVGVKTSSAEANQDLGTDMHIKVGGVIDAIAGATPTGQPAPPGSDQVVLTHMHGYRKAWSGEFSDQFPRVHVALGFSRSLEYDYVSNGWSVNTLTDFNQKNTTLLLGYAGTENNIEVQFRPPVGYSPWYKKHTHDFVAGLTQLLDPRTSLTFDVTWSHSTGYLSEPYKLVLKNVQIFPGVVIPQTFGENRPWEREKGIALLALNHAYPKVHGAVEASYRFYDDSFGIVAHTAELAWYQHLGPAVIVRPDLRLYQQDAASFYHYNLDQTAITPARIPTPSAPHYSSDGRLSALQTIDYGLKVVWTAAAWLEFDATVEAYRMRGTDGVTPQSAYYQANISSIGVKISW